MSQVKKSGFREVSKCSESFYGASRNKYKQNLIVNVKVAEGAEDSYHKMRNLMSLAAFVAIVSISISIQKRYTAKVALVIKQIN